ncbi:sensor histidine kinase [Streptomyces lusitanus]|uniref:histidine kinase n=1 Tax=Streptomyces lusitanus TaxID=68232 RepID=A0ABU3JNP5_9ACTN|nr:histidine kinase [Streptomyces lusitanus]
MANRRGIGGFLGRDASGSLTRQSVMVAGFCVVSDVVTFCYEGTYLWPTAAFWCLLAGIVLVDAALASAARHSGVVALAQAVLAITGAVVLAGPLAPSGGDGSLPDMNDSGMVVAAYRAGAWLHGRPALLALLALAAGSTVAEMLDENGLGAWHTSLLSAVDNALLGWLVGRYTTARGAHIAEVEQRAVRERERAQQALTDAIAEERSAIARDLHDVIAHHVSAIGVHAGAARLALPSASPARTPRVATALAAVETSSRAALLDLRRLLDFLHDSPAEGARQPGLDDLDELVHVMAEAGLETRIGVEGTRQKLESSLDIAVYRVVQEMLTNALRHGDGHVDLTLGYSASSVTVTAVNPVAASGPVLKETPHRGLEGISSRAGMFDGCAAYGPVRGGTHWKTTVTFTVEGT